MRSRFAAVLVCLVAFGCRATDIRKYSVPVALEAAQANGQAFEVDEALRSSLAGDIGLSTIQAGSRWRLHGSIPQGAVYSSRESVLMANTGNLHEALPVVSEGRLVGVYLPFEKVFLAAVAPAPLRTHPVTDPNGVPTPKADSP